MDASIRLRHADDRQALQQWISTQAVLEAAGGQGEGRRRNDQGGTPTAAATWARGMNRGLVTRSLAEPPPRDRDFWRRFCVRCPMSAGLAEGDRGRSFRWPTRGRRDRLGGPLSIYTPGRLWAWEASCALCSPPRAVGLVASRRYPRRTTIRATRSVLVCGCAGKRERRDGGRSGTLVTRANGLHGRRPFPLAGGARGPSSARVGERGKRANARCSTGGQALHQLLR